MKIWNFLAIWSATLAIFRRSQVFFGIRIFDSFLAADVKTVKIAIDEEKSYWNED